MTAKFERRKTELYAMDLVWKIAQHYWDIQTPQPTLFELEHKRPDRRSAEQIVADMRKKAQELADGSV